MGSSGLVKKSERLCAYTPATGTFRGGGGGGGGGTAGHQRSVRSQISPRSRSRPFDTSRCSAKILRASGSEDKMPKFKHHDLSGASLALFYFFALIRNLFTDSSVNSVRVIGNLLD